MNLIDEIKCKIAEKKAKKAEDKYYADSTTHIKLTWKDTKKMMAWRIIAKKSTPKR